MPGLDVGQRFAGYTVVGVVGASGTGDAYLVKSPRLPRPGVLRWLSHPLADAAAELAHPNIVRILDHGQTDGQPWSVEEHLAATEVERIMTGHPRGLPVRQAVDIVRDVAIALDYAHQRGVLHLSVEPAHVLILEPIVPRQAVLLSGFGMAHPAGGPSDGAPWHASPERRAGRALDGRADQYSLAATAHYLLTGAVPSPGQAIGSVRPDLSPANAVLGRALAAEPRARWGSCTEFANELLVALTTSDEVTQVKGPPVYVGDGGDVAAPTQRHVAPQRPPPAFRPGPPPPASTLPDTHPQPRRSRKGLIAGCALAAAVIALTGAVIALVARDDPVDGPDAVATSPNPTKPATTSSASRPSSPAEKVTLIFDGDRRPVRGGVTCDASRDQLVVYFPDEFGMSVRTRRGPNPRVLSVALGRIDGYFWYSYPDQLQAESPDGQEFRIAGKVQAEDPARRGTYIYEDYELSFVCP